MSAPAETAAQPRPGLLDLFLAFSGIAIIGFGGVLPLARRMLVEQKRWLSAEEFTEVLSLAQFLPGGNIVNVSVVVGGRLAGPLGAIAAVAGLMAAPTVIVLMAGALYLRYQDLPAVHGALTGLAAAAVGLIVSMFVKMFQPLVAQRAPLPIVIVAITFVAIGIFKFSLPLVVLALTPISTVLLWRRRD